MSETKTLTKAEQARRGPQELVDRKESVPESDTRSPFVPLDVPFNYGRGRNYNLVFDYESVRNDLKTKYDSKVIIARARLEKRLPPGVQIKTGKKLSDYLDVIPDELLEDLQSLGSGPEFYKLKVEMYVPHLLEWDVPLPNGDIAPISVEAFLARPGGFHAAVVEKLHELFTEPDSTPSAENSTPTPES